MIGVHAFWSKPTLTGTNGHHLVGRENFDMHDFEIVHFLLSALYYKKLNGPIHLYTDDTFFEYLRHKGLLHVWDKIDTSLYKEFKKLGLNSKSNWTGFKTWLLQKIPAPFLLLDHDNMVYTKIPKELFKTPVRFAHLEIPNPHWYPAKEDIQVSNFKFDDSWDWTLNVPNTCMLYFKDDGFKDLYSKISIQFQLGNTTDDKHLGEVQYLFADQRLLLMLLHQHKVEYGTFCNHIFGSVRPDDDPVWVKYSDDETIRQVGFDHTWAHKHNLLNSEYHYTEYMDRHKDIIFNTFPEHKEIFRQFYNDTQF